MSPIMTKRRVLWPKRHFPYCLSLELVELITSFN